ncbi:hypothetical protein HY251_19740 [bacterium]|nr:hypothetical protein [bacterium]
MRLARPRLLPLVLASATGAALLQGCFLFGGECSSFKSDPTKYDFLKIDGDKLATKEAGPFVVAAYCKGTPRDLVREAIEAALKDSGGGSLGDLKDEGGNYHNFARWVPYGGENTAVTFETNFKSKDLNIGDPIEIVWRGTTNERSFECNKLENGKPVAGYPTIAPVGDKFHLKMPLEYAADKKKTLIAVVKLEERPEGGFKFKGQLPFAIRSKAKPGADIAVEWDGKEDKITPELESIEFFTVTGFKGDPRDFQCHLMHKEVKTQNGSLLTFDLALTTAWFKVTGHAEAAFKVFTATGEITGESGKVSRIEAKLPEGYPQPGKKYESKDKLNAVQAKDQQAGDYVLEYDTDEQTAKVTYSLNIRIPVVKGSKDPDKVEFTIEVKQASGGSKSYTPVWKSEEK